MSESTRETGLPDVQARERALDPRTSFIVTAPAGSGKTELLIRRMLVLLARVEHPEEIVAITFTRKAAAEMRARVLAAMREVAEAVPPKEKADEARQELARMTLARDRERGWGLLEHPARLRMMTFDSLCASLVRQMPLLTGLGGMPEPLDDASALYREAALDTLRAAGGAGASREARDARLLLEHLDNRTARVIDLLAEMLAHREQWLRHIVSAGPDFARLRANVEAGWQGEIRRVLDGARVSIPAALIDDLVSCAAYAGGNVEALGACARLTTLPGSSENDLPAWRGVAQLLLTNDGEFRKQVDVRNGFPAGKKGSPEAAVKDRMKALLQAFSSDREFLEQLVLVRSLPSIRFEDRQWEILAALIRLLPIAAARLALVFAQRGQADFIEIARRANDALGESDEPTDLALRLDYRIRHLLVDEFQDTSLTQRDLLLRLTAGWEPDDGRTLFCVGDPMQSIYRFREAEVGVFLEVEKRGLGDLRLEPLRLSSNFRSDPAIVEWVNTKIAPLFAARADPALGAVDYTPSAPTRDPVADAGVVFHALRDADAGQEAQAVTEIVRESLMRRPEDRIAVLVRSRSMLATLLPALGAADIPYTGVAIENLAEQPVLEDLLSLARALACPADRLAWLAVLRAPWCGLLLADLHALAAGDRAAPICQLLADAERLAQLSADGQLRLARVAPVLLAALGERGRDEPVRFLERLWTQLGAPACLEPDEFEHAQYFFHLYEQHTQAGRADLEELERTLAEQYATPKSEIVARVQIMTLHKAKGLEFETVVIPALQTSPGSDRGKLLRWDEPVGGDALLFGPGPEFGGSDPHHDYLKARERERNLLELRRLIYVGVTRAKRNLHLVGVVKSNGKGEMKIPPARTLLGELWPSVAREFEKPEAGATLGARAGTAPMLHRLPGGWSPPAPPRLLRTLPGLPVSEQTVEFSWAGETARAIGVLVHEQLRRFAATGLSAGMSSLVARRREYWLRRLAAEGVPEGERDGAADRVVEALANVTEDQRARWLFASGRAETQTEYAVSVLEGGRLRNLRMDLSFVDEEGRRWIVDYKTGTHSGGGAEEFLDSERERYRPQLERYAAAMAGIDSRPIRLGLYFPLLRGWREWAFHVPA
jgi:ATP-dependent exoDNAse (exonuclease V) beta subunit